MFDDLNFRFQRYYLRQYLKKTRAWYRSDQERHLLKVFRRCVSSVPAYRLILEERGVDPARIQSVEDFIRLVPVIDKFDTFIPYGDRVSSLCVDGELGDIVSVLVSSGYSGKFSYGLLSRKEDRAERNLVDLFLDQRFHIKDRRTLLVNCLSMGVRVPSRRSVVAEVSVRPDMAVALVKSFGRDFEQILMIGDNTFMKCLLEAGLEAGLDWPDYDIRIIVGEEGFPESYRNYLASLLGRDLDKASEMIIGSSMGISEIGLSVFQESLETIRTRRKIDAAPDLRRTYFGGYPFTPMIFNYLPLFVYLEELKRENDPLPEFLFTPLSMRRRLPLIRYNSHDRGMHFEPGEELRNDITTNLPLVAVFGRGAHIEVTGKAVYVEGVKEILYCDKAFASRITGNFMLPPGVHEHNRVPLRIQMKEGVAASPELKGQAEELTCRYYGDLLQAQLVRFDEMPLDFERKLPYLGSI